ncbi:unnamed protein product [Malus baccata var. baccata]
MAVLELLFLFSFLLTIFLLLRPVFVSKSETLLPPSPLALPIIGHFYLLGPLLHRSFYKLSLQFGPLFSLRLGSVPCIVVTSPEIAKAFLKTHELSFISRAQTIAIERLTYNYSTPGFAPYGPYYKLIKKLSVNEFLSNRNVSNFASIRTQEYLSLLRLLAKKAESGEAINLTEELPKHFNNVIAKMMLGNSKGSSAEGRDEEARLVAREVTRIFGEFNLSDFVWFCKKLDLQGFGKRIENTHRRYDALMEKVISEREELRKKNMKNGGDNVEEEMVLKDFLDVLLDLLEKGSGEIEGVKFTRVHIKALIMGFFTAGTDATAILMEWALAELINHPKVLKKVREEIDQAVGNKRLLVESDGPNLPYIQAVIKEACRLHPPVSVVTRKCVEKCKFGKYVIPENTMLFVNVWAIGRDPKYWENPLDFQPERFLSQPLSGGRDGTSALDVRGQHFELLPFGSGRRICPGVNLVMQMLPSLLGAMVQCFDWKVIGPQQKKMNGNDLILEMDERPGMTTPRAHDLVCIPVARLNLLDVLDP